MPLERDGSVPFVKMASDRELPFRRRSYLSRFLMFWVALIVDNAMFAALIFGGVPTGLTVLAGTFGVPILISLTVVQTVTS